MSLPDNDYQILRLTDQFYEAHHETANVESTGI